MKNKFPKNVFAVKESLFSKSQAMNPENLFLYFGIGFGFLFLFITPPFQSPDEYSHFFRAYHISEGRPVPRDHDTLPVSIMEFTKAVSPYPLFGHCLIKESKRTLLDQFKKHFDDKERISIPKDATATISCSLVSYLPQASGILLGRLCKAPPILIFYLGRLINLAVYLSLAWMAIKTTPVLKWFFLLLALMPMSMFQAASNSPDALVNAASFLFVTNIFRMAFDREGKLHLKDCLSLGLAAFLLGATKPLYLLLLGLLPMVPACRFIRRRECIIFIFMVVSLSLIPAIGWYLTIDGGVNTRANVYPSAQIRFIWNYPWTFIQLLVRSWIDQIILQQKLFVGRFGWLDTPLPIFIYPLYMIGLVLAAMINGNKTKKISPFFRVYSFALFIGLVILIFTFFFITWTEPGARNIEGVQGRYMIPIAPLFFIMFMNGRIKKPWWLGYAMAVYISFILSVSVKTLLDRFYMF
jgi:uncharacterized membrane protein